MSRVKKATKKHKAVIPVEVQTTVAFREWEGGAVVGRVPERGCQTKFYFSTHAGFSCLIIIHRVVHLFCMFLLFVLFYNTKAFLKR